MKRVIFLIILINVIQMFGQNQTQPANGKDPNLKPEPIDLPNFIIKGKMQLDVNSGLKQEPGKPQPLNAGLLDSLNSLEKQPAMLIPVEEIPVYENSYNIKDGFLSASFGRYGIGDFALGYGLKTEGYDIYGKADFNFGSGHVDNSDFSKFNLQLTSDYIAPLKFFIFGGSRTRTNISYNNTGYKLYSAQNPAERSINHFAANIDVDGNYGGFLFKTGAGFNGFQLKSNDIKTADNNFYGYANLNKFVDKFLLAGNIILDLHSIKGKGANFIQLDGSISYVEEDVSLSGNAGLQLASTPDGNDRGGLLIAGAVEYRINKFLTAAGRIKSGLEQKSFMDFYVKNPYLSNFAGFDYTYDILNLSGILYFHPYQDLMVSAELKFRHSDRIPVFIDDTGLLPGSFDITYQSGTIIKSIFEINWQFTQNDLITSNITACQTSLSDFTSKSITYNPEFKMSIFYGRNWSEKFGTKIGVTYIGERYSDLDNLRKIDGYLNIGAEGEFRLSENLKIFGNLDNLINSDIIIWNGYKEKGIFASVGVRYQF